VELRSQALGLVDLRRDHGASVQDLRRGTAADL
jgi:hypothetical protein